MDLLSIAAIAVIIYVTVMFLLKVSIFGIYIYFVLKFFKSESDHYSSLDSEQFNPNLNTQLAIWGLFGAPFFFLSKGLLSCLPTTIITSECECACMHMPRLTMVPCVPRTCPDVEPCSGTVSNACHYSVKGACACRRFHGSAKFSSYYITVDHRPRIKNDE